ncbi:activin receptor type-1 [Lepeophtheirus salmonis]|uniref:activin receptor type-1 n=1 Tax=Lepeophtheirus salmonis TaxID=72036 RepID=UPI001AE40441|nr:activin receptor type-1-like [Lepeophtheirus salmonis]
MVRYSCYSCDTPECEKERVCDGAVQCYTSHVRDSEGHVRRNKGCAKHLEHAIFYCSTPSYDGRRHHEMYQTSGQYAFSCCRGHLCNNETVWPELPPVPIVSAPDPLPVPVSPENASNSPSKLILAITCPILVFFLLLAFILFIMHRAHKKRMKGHHRVPVDFHEGSADLDELGLRATAAGDSTLREVFNDRSMTSGSGAGQPFLVQRTLAKQIVLGDCIGKGRYGEVWKGVYNGDNVAVKIFFSRDEDSWKRETDIYLTTLIRHENILGYIASDCTSVNSCTQLWLVTHYHPLGSLYDHLNRTSLSVEESMKILISTLNGLVHLHTEIFGTKGKPGIAHRDMKTKNVLVRMDGTCVIADFGLAVTHTIANNELIIPQNCRVGTKRYMSPEILDMSINVNHFESYRMVDIYAFSLVIWEILRRTRSSENNKANEFALPYYTDVNPDPGFDEMRKVVCIDNRRPEILSRWEADPVIKQIVKIMKECWHENATARLPVLRIKKSMKNIILSDPKLHLIFDEIC